MWFWWPWPFVSNMMYAHYRRHRRILILRRILRHSCKHTPRVIKERRHINQIILSQSFSRLFDQWGVLQVSQNSHQWLHVVLKWKVIVSIIKLCHANTCSWTRLCCTNASLLWPSHRDGGSDRVESWRKKQRFSFSFLHVVNLPVGIFCSAHCEVFGNLGTACALSTSPSPTQSNNHTISVSEAAWIHKYIV